MMEDGRLYSESCGKTVCFLWIGVDTISRIRGRNFQGGTIRKHFKSIRIVGREHEISQV